MFEKIGSTLRTANEALADAQKSWRDGDLTERDKRLVGRESALAEREAEFRQRVSAFERTRAKGWIRAAVAVCLAVGVAIFSFFAGAMLARSPSDPAHSTVVASAAVNAPSESDSPGTQTVSEAPPLADERVSFRDCVAKGEAYYKEIDAWPTLTSTGQNARSAVIERCGRTTEAFGN